MESKNNNNLPQRDSNSLPIIEGYQIFRCIGRGAMGSVWKAVQLSTRREVAIKFLSQQRLVSSKSRRHFEQEIQLAARLSHPNIAHIYDSGLCQGRYFYSMEYIEGLHLDQYVIQNRLNTKAILELSVKICQAVGYAHQKGIIHRDLKPANILVSADGQPHILDFGLAMTDFREDTFAVSLEGELAGTIAYMSPEQAAGRKQQITPASDVYSLGVILYKLLTGTFPKDMSGDYYDILRRIVEEPAIPASKVMSIDSVLERILACALSQDSTQRYQTAGDLERQLYSYLSGSSDILPSRPIRQQPDKRKWMAAAVILFLVCTGCLLLYTFWPRPQPQPSMQTPMQNAPPQPVGSTAAKKDGATPESTGNFTDKSGEYDAGQCLQRLDRFISQKDYFRAKVTLSYFNENYSHTQVARRYANRLMDWDQDIRREFTGKEIVDHIDYLFVPYSSVPQAWKNASRQSASMQTMFGRQIRQILFRVMLENETSEKKMLIQGDWPVRVPFGKNSFIPSSNYLAESGEIIVLTDEHSPLRETNSRIRVSIRSLYHCPVQIEIPLTSDDTLYYGELLIRCLPPEAKGQLVIRIEPETGLSLAGGRISLENNLLTIPLKDAGTYNLGDIAAGTYRVIANNKDYYSSQAQKIEIRPQEKTEVCLAVYRSHEVTFQWRFFDFQNSKSSAGKAAVRTGQSWTPADWGEIFYPVIEFTPWDGSGCMIKNVHGSLKRGEGISDINTISFPMNLDDSLSPGSFPLQKGAAYVWYRYLPDERYEALIQIENIAPARADK